MLKILWKILHFLTLLKIINKNPNKTLKIMKSSIYQIFNIEFHTSMPNKKYNSQEIHLILLKSLEPKFSTKNQRIKY